MRSGQVRSGQIRSDQSQFNCMNETISTNKNCLAHNLSFASGGGDRYACKSHVKN